MGTMEGLVREFKYEVEDEFTYCGSAGKRKILARYKSVEGLNNYVVRYDSEDEILSEEYITKNYKKIEPFFEEGKKYRRSDDKTSWTCHFVTEVLGKKIALMTYGVGVRLNIFEQCEFGDYREVK